MLILKRFFNQFTFLAIIQDTCTQYFLYTPSFPCFCEYILNNKYKKQGNSQMSLRFGFRLQKLKIQTWDSMTCPWKACGTQVTNTTCGPLVFLGMLRCTEGRVAASFVEHYWSSYRDYNFWGKFLFIFSLLIYNIKLVGF